MGGSDNCQRWAACQFCGKIGIEWSGIANRLRCCERGKNQEDNFGNSKLIEKAVSFATAKRFY